MAYLNDDFLGYGDFSLVYDMLMADVDYKKRASFLAALFSDYYENKNQKKVNSVLDLACGTGSLTFELASLGYELIGVDISENMLAVAQNKLESFNITKEIVKPMFLLQDMRELDLYGTVQVAVSSLDSFNHLISHDDVDKFLSRLKFFIEPGGLFVFDVNTIYKHKNVLGNNNFVFEEDNVYVTWCNEFDEQQNIVQIYLDIFINETEDKYRRVSEQITERAYEIDEIKSMLAKHEFEFVDVFDDTTFDKPKEDSERLTVIARRI